MVSSAEGIRYSCVLSQMSVSVVPVCVCDLTLSEILLAVLLLLEYVALKMEATFTDRLTVCPAEGKTHTTTLTYTQIHYACLNSTLTHINAQGYFPRYIL